MHRLSDAPSEQHLNTYLALTDSVTEQIMVKGKIFSIEESLEVLQTSVNDELML